MCVGNRWEITVAVLRHILPVTSCPACCFTVVRALVPSQLSLFRACSSYLLVGLWVGCVQDSKTAIWNLVATPWARNSTVVRWEEQPHNHIEPTTNKPRAVYNGSSAYEKVKKSLIVYPRPQHMLFGVLYHMCDCDLKCTNRRTASKDGTIVDVCVILVR